jgi:hypothetical protein
MLATLFWDREISRKMFPCYLRTENFLKKPGTHGRHPFLEGRFYSIHPSLSEDSLPSPEIINQSGLTDK